eukprot:scaffold286_cov247-Pinguiococcus_pyrenoidosus.AAC.23
MPECSPVPSCSAGKVSIFRRVPIHFSSIPSTTPVFPLGTLKHVSLPNMHAGAKSESEKLKLS